MELSDKEVRWYGLTFLIIFIVMVLFALSGCAGTEKPVDTLRDLVCPKTYVEEYKACEGSSDRLEGRLYEALAAEEACSLRFNKHLSKSR